MTPEQPDTPSPADEIAKHRAEASIEEFKRLVMDADIVCVGENHDYVPDSPRLRKNHPNAEDE